MKNPMDRQLENRLWKRAVAIGRKGDVDAVDELLEMPGSSSANVRRLSASAPGKPARERKVWQRLTVSGRTGL